MHAAEIVNVGSLLPLAARCPNDCCAGKTGIGFSSFAYAALHRTSDERELSRIGFISVPGSVQWPLRALCFSHRVGQPRPEKLWVSYLFPV